MTSDLCFPLFLGSSFVLISTTETVTRTVTRMTMRGRTRCCSPPARLATSEPMLAMAFRTLPLNGPVVVALTPEKGEIAFVCGMNMLKGSVVVR